MDVPHALISIRTGLSYTQSVMAGRLGLSLRQYQEIESGRSDCRAIHMLAAERVAMIDAISQKDIAAAPAKVRNDALALADLIRSGPS